jgi:hypothetical protein
MATAKSLPELNSQVDSNFPNNTTKLITPTLLRGQQKDFIVSTPYSFFDGVPGAGQNVAAGYLIGKSRIIDFNTQIEYLYASGTTTAVWSVITASGSPGGSTTQLQWNDAGAFGGISGATTNGTAVTFASGALIGTDFKASGSAGVSILNSSGTTVALFGAGGGIGVSLNGGTNIGAASADYWGFAGGTGTIAMTATGSSSNININLVPKGTGVLQSNGVTVATLTGTQTLTNKTLTSPVINVGSDATGDIYYRSVGGLFTRLAAGSNGHVLTLSAGIPSWAAGGGGGSLTIGSSSISGGAVGRVLFEGTGNVLQESANFLWDNTNARMSLGSGAGTTAVLSLAGATASIGHLLLNPSAAALTSTTDGMLQYSNVAGTTDLFLTKVSSVTKILTMDTNSGLTGASTVNINTDASGNISRGGEVTALGIFSSVTDVTTTSTSAATVIGTLGAGNLDLSANFFAVGKTVRITAIGKITTSGTPGTISFVFSLDGATIYTVTSPTLTASITDKKYKLVLDIVCRSVGGTGALQVSADLFIDILAGSVYVVPSAGTNTINTANILTINLTSQFSAASHSITTAQVFAEYLN